MRSVWVFTVLYATHRASAMDWRLRPRASSASTSVSRADRPCTRETSAQRSLSMASNTSDKSIWAASARVTFSGATAAPDVSSGRSRDSATPMPGDATLSITMNRYTMSTDTPTNSMDELEPKLNPTNVPMSKPTFMPDFPIPNTNALGAPTFDAMSVSDAHTYISNRMYPDMMATAASAS